MKTEIEIGFSPCPNDTFIFDALVNGLIDTGDYVFIPVLADVQTLNEWALSEKLAVSKISYGVLPQLLSAYQVLDAGSALGRGVGPLLIGKDFKKHHTLSGEVPVAIPGKDTTAHLLFSMAYPAVTEKVFLPYDAIEDFVQCGNGLGVIIHENRFTYQDKGLFKILDLGDFWEKETKNPIPLGGIVASRKLCAEVKNDISNFIKNSISYAYAHYQTTLSDYIQSHAQEMSAEVMRKHIDLYVNEYSLSLGEKGRAAIEKLLSVSATLSGKKVKDVRDIFA